MIKELRDKFPSWVNEINKDNYLILSDDIDSLFSAALLKYWFGCEVKAFMDWNSGINGKQQCLYSNSCITNKDGIGVDMAIEEGKCFDNHVCMLGTNDLVNENSANLNLINKINRSNYYDKFCSSTLIQVISLHGADINKFNDEQKLAICSIDGMYMPYKIWKIDFSQIQRSYMKQLEYEELSDFMKYYCDKSGYSEFEKIKSKYNLDGKIWVTSEGKLETNIDIEGLSNLFGGFDMSLPDGEFEEVKRLDKYTINLNNNYVNSKDCLAEDGLFNFVLTNKNYCVYSM